MDGAAGMFVVLDSVRSLHCGTARIDVDEMPGGERAFVIQAGLGFDDARRPEVRPGKFLFARPTQGNGFAPGLRETSGFD